MQTLTLDARYQPQVHALYAKVRAPYTMLLESAEVADKSGKQSFIGISCALKIAAQGRTVYLMPLNHNGSLVCRELCRTLPLAACTLPPFLSQGQERQGFAVSFPESREINEVKRLKDPSPLDVLRAVREMFKDFPQLLFTGMIAFDYIRSCERFPKLPDEPEHLDLCWYLYDLSVTVNHIRRTLSINLFALDEDSYASSGLKALRLKSLIDKEEYSLNIPEEQPAPHFTPDLDDAAFAKIVAALKEHIRQGDIFQAVPSRSFSLPCPDPYSAYCCLKSANSSPYAFYFADPGFVLFGASPEFALKCDAQTGLAAISPIAGTRARGLKADGSIDADLDARLELELRTDRKEIAEHLMLVDLARNDLARIAVPGTRQISNLLHVDRYQSVMHLVSDVTAQLRPDLDALHAYAAAANMGTLSGAPKIKAHELIYRYEGRRRGFYGGVVGILSADGSFDSCIVIRSAVVKNGVAKVQAGCGVVYDSDPASEAQETLNKARSVLLAIARSSAGETSDAEIK